MRFANIVCCLLEPYISELLLLLLHYFLIFFFIFPSSPFLLMGSLGGLLNGRENGDKQPSCWETFANLKEPFSETGVPCS